MSGVAQPTRGRQRAPLGMTLIWESTAGSTMSEADPRQKIWRQEPSGGPDAKASADIQQVIQMITEVAVEGASMAPGGLPTLSAEG